jgi:hypothetical protein
MQETVRPRKRPAGWEIVHGREPEQKIVRDLLQRAQRRIGGAVLIDGEPGIGRSLFEGLSVEPGIGQTALVGEIRDQSHLYGVLDLMRELGLDLVSVETNRGTSGPDDEENARLKGSAGLAARHLNHPRSIATPDRLTGWREASTSARSENLDLPNGRWFGCRLLSSPSGQGRRTASRRG